MRKYQRLQIDAEELGKENEKNMEKLEKLKEKLLRQGVLAPPPEKKEV